MIFFSLLLARPALAQQAGIVTAPVAGQAVRGVVAITGTSEMEGFQSAEVAFAYHNDPTATWFLVQQSETPVLSDTLAVWDTTAITDAVYDIRLRIFLLDGSVVDTLVTGVRVRNYTPDEAFSADAAAAQPTPGLLPLPAPTDPPRPTPLPPNPAEVTPAKAYRTMRDGALIVVLLFALLGFLIWARRR